jgi:hypothetical protein
MVKLRIPIRARRSFQSLAIGLQAVVHLMQKFCHHAVARVVPRALEFGGQLPYALASPPQGRLRITASYRLHQCLQIALESRVLDNGSLSPGSLPPDSLAARRLRRNLNLGHPADHGSSGQAAGLRHCGDPAQANGFGLGGCDQTARAFVQNARKQLELARQTPGVWH